MKKLIKASTVVAVLNLIAVLAGVGWVFASGRRSEERRVGKEC